MVMVAAPQASAAINVIGGGADLLVVDQACIGHVTVCDNHFDHPVATSAAGQGYAFDQSIAETQAVEHEGDQGLGTFAQATGDATGSWKATLTPSASSLSLTMGGHLAGSWAFTQQSGSNRSFQGFGQAAGFASVHFQVTSPAPYTVAVTASSDGAVELARDGGGFVYNSRLATGSPSGTLDPGVYEFDGSASVAIQTSQDVSGPQDLHDSKATDFSASLTVTGGCADVPVGFAVAQGCFTERGNGTGVFTTDQPAWVGGFELHPKPGGLLVVDTQAKLIRTEGAGVDTVFDGTAVPIPAELLPVAVPSASIDVGQAGSVEKVMGLPVKGKLAVTWTGGGKGSTVEGELSLSDLVASFGLFVSTNQSGGSTVGGKVKLTLTNGTGVEVSSAQASIDELDVVPIVFKNPNTLALKNVLVKYAKQNGKPFWSGQAFIALPLKGGTIDVGGHVDLLDGHVIGGGVAVDNLNKEIPDTPVFLQKIGGDLQFEPSFGMNLAVSASIGPRTNGKQIVGLDGTLTSGSLVPASDCPNGQDPFELQGVATITALSKTELLPKSTLTMRTCGYVGPNVAQDASMIADLQFVGGGLGVKSTTSGFIGRKGFLQEGAAVVSLPLMPKLSGNLIVSNVGLAACGSLGFFSGGFALRWNGFAPPVPSTLSGCDLTPFRPTTAARAAATKRRAITVAVPPGQRLFAFAARSATGAPRVRVTGPGGTFANPDGRAVRSKRVVIVPSDSEHTTYVVVNHPRAGRWRVASIDPRRPLTGVSTARGLPKPRVSGKVVGRGATRTLVYSAKLIGGEKVTFFDADRSLGSARRTRGRLRFRVVQTGRARHTIVAQVTQNGLPRAELTVAHYVATR